jgi:hypothetical protein
VSQVPSVYKYRLCRHRVRLIAGLGLRPRHGSAETTSETTMGELNVFITTTYYCPEEAGSTPYLAGLARHLQEQGLK